MCHFTSTAGKCQHSTVFEAFSCRRHCLCTGTRAGFGAACSSGQTNWTGCSAVRSHGCTWARGKPHAPGNLPRQSTRKAAEPACLTSMSHTSSRSQPNPHLLYESKEQCWEFTFNHRITNNILMALTWFVVSYNHNFYPNIWSCFGFQIFPAVHRPNAHKSLMLFTAPHY